MNTSTVGIPWYRAETYALVRAMVVDGAQMHATFESWLASAQALEAQLAAQGLRVVRMDIDLEAYQAWRSEREPVRREEPAVRPRVIGESRSREGHRRRSRGTENGGLAYVSASASTPVTSTQHPMGVRMQMQTISLAATFAAFHDHWNPRIVGELNGQQVKVAKFQGAFVWHHHEHEDEMFLVHRGRFRMEFRDRVVELAAGDFLIVPRGVEHRPVADDEVEVVLFEPATTRNTGNVVNERTIAEPARLEM